MGSGSHTQYRNFTEEEIQDILTAPLSYNKLAAKYGVGKIYIRNIILRSGVIKTPQPGGKPKKEKIPKPPKPAPIKKPAKVVKPKPKKTPKPVPRKKKEALPKSTEKLQKQVKAARSGFEEHKILKESAETLVENNNKAEKDLRQQGFRWISETDQYGKKKMVFRDPNKKPAS